MLTFDYELCLGRDSGTLLTTLINPTKIILDLLKKHNGTGIFFVDAAYLLTLKENKHKDFDIVKKQIQEIALNNCSVELHIHPQWLDSYPVGHDRWSFKSFNNYRIYALKNEEKDKLFCECIFILEKILQEVLPDYKISAFRAGGWCVQPFDFLKEIFIKNKIKFDFSVQPGLYQSNLPMHYYDFRKSPKNLSFWRFSDDPLMIDTNGIFWEIPVSTVKFSNLSLWLNYFMFRKKEKNPADNIDDEKNQKDRKYDKKDLISKLLKLFILFNKKYFTFSIDGLSGRYFIKYLKKTKGKKFRFLTGVCHPKTFSDSGIKNLEFVLRNFKTLNIKDLNMLLG